MPSPKESGPYAQDTRCELHPHRECLEATLKAPLRAVQVTFLKEVFTSQFNLSKLVMQNCVKVSGSQRRRRKLQAAVTHESQAVAERKSAWENDSDAIFEAQVLLNSIDFGATDTLT